MTARAPPSPPASPGRVTRVPSLERPVEPPELERRRPPTLVPHPPGTCFARAHTAVRRCRAARDRLRIGVSAVPETLPSLCVPLPACAPRSDGLGRFKGGRRRRRRSALRRSARRCCHRRQTGHGGANGSGGQRGWCDWCGECASKSRGQWRCCCTRARRARACTCACERARGSTRARSAQQRPQRRRRGSRLQGRSCTCGGCAWTL
jgi:hypothetical protein